MATNNKDVMEKGLLAGDNEDNKIDESIFVFEKTYRECGIRLRVDELSWIDTATQRYGVKLVLDRTWKASDDDIKHWEELRHPETDGFLRDYHPDYVPFINFANSISCSNIAPQDWEQTGGKYMIQKSPLDGEYYNRYKVKGEYEFTEEFEVESYPFDFQDLSMVITPETSSIEEQRLVPHHIIPGYFTMNITWSSITDWKIVGLYCKEYVLDTKKAIINGVSDDFDTVEKYKGQKESWVNYKIQVKRRWRGIMSRVCLWMFLLGVLSFCIFAHSHREVGDRLSFGITMVLTIVAFQFVITSSLPQVNYLTLIDKYNLFIFVINGAMIVEAGILGIESLADHDSIFGLISAQDLDVFFIAVFVIVFVLGHIVFAVVAYKRNKAEWLKEGIDEELNVQFMQQKNSREEYPSSDRGIPALRPKKSKFAIISALQTETETKQ